MLFLALLPTALAAPAWAPLRVALDCQSAERVDACTYVRGALDALDVVAVVPLSEAQLDLHLNATRAASDDHIQLRAVADASLTGAPASFEQQVVIDYRLPVDDQRARLDPALYRVLAPYLSVAVPDAVAVTFHAPDGAPEAVRTSPWAFAVWAGGYGSWSQDYRNLTAWSGLSLARITDTDKQDIWIDYDRSIELQPSLVVNSTDVALTSDSSAVEGAVTASWNLNGHWTLGGNLRGGHDDPEGQYFATGRADVGVEYNLFPSDDPRGNVLAVAYLAGAQADWYNEPNTLGQDRAAFPAHMLVAAGSVRVDRVQLELDLHAQAQLVPFVQRYVLGASLHTELTLGDHVDLTLDTDATQQAIPGPATIDASNYEQVTRASYAQPLAIQGYLSMRVHWDNTNSARNNRFHTIGSIDVTGGL